MNLNEIILNAIVLLKTLLKAIVNKMIVLVVKI